MSKEDKLNRFITTRMQQLLDDEFRKCIFLGSNSFNDPSNNLTMDKIASTIKHIKEEFPVEYRRWQLRYDIDNFYLKLNEMESNK